MEPNMALTRTKPMSEAEFRQFSLDDSQGQWELVNGQPRERPGMMSAEHGDVMMFFAAQLFNQLDPSEYRVRVQHARLRVSPSTYFIPDVAVIPTAFYLALLTRPGSLDAYPEPVPLVAEVRSPSTGDYDIDEKLPGYQQRGDAEIWYLHPYERTLTAWRREPDGRYAKAIHRGGLLAIASLPDVEIDLDRVLAG
jgi:Uma2 family endonuclease